MKFYEDFNESLKDIQESIQGLFDRAKEQAIAFEEKNHAALNELLNIQKRDDDNEDTFLDGGKIQSTTTLSLDKDGWTTSFVAEEIKFLDEYYSKVAHPMNMVNGRIIPGSDFSGIFKDRSGFWGYFRDDGVETEADFTLTFKLRANETSLYANKIHLMTMNDVIVEAFYRPTFGSDWISLGTKEGRHHVWTKPFNGVEIRFVVKSDVFAVSYVAVAKAIFSTAGSLISTYYEIDNLRILDIDDESDIPAGTAIRKFVHITSEEPEEIPTSGWIPWEDEDIVTLACTEYEIPVASGYIIPSGYIEESLVLRSGYTQWDDVNTTDMALVTEPLARLGTNFLDIPAGYEVIAGGVKAVFVGEGETRTEFAKDDDYIIQYDTTNDTIKISNIPGGRMDGLTEDIVAEVLMRKPVEVIQRRTFVLLEEDADIVISIPTAGITVRTLFIGDSIENDTTVQNVDVGTYTIDGKAGLNLIEISGHDTLNPPELVGTYTYFARRYWETQVETPGPTNHEFYLEPVLGGFKVVSPQSDLYLRYLIPSDNNKVSVRFEFEGTQDIAPVLRSYKLVNKIDKL